MTTRHEVHQSEFFCHLSHSIGISAELFIEIAQNNEGRSSLSIVFFEGLQKISAKSRSRILDGILIKTEETCLLRGYCDAACFRCFVDWLIDGEDDDSGICSARKLLGDPATPRVPSIFGNSTRKALDCYH